MGACSFFFSFFSFFQQIATALHSPPSPKQATTGEHRMEEELRKGCTVALMVLTFNCGLAAYLLWGDAECVASVGVTYVVIVLLLARHFGCWERGTHTLILLLTLSDAALLASRVARTAAPSASALLVAAAGATALVLGGFFSYMLHRRSWSKQHRQQMILPLVLESHS